MSRTLVKWALLGLLVASVGATVMYFGKEYLQRGVAIDSIETTQKQNERFSESVQELTEKKEKDDIEIKQAVEAAEGKDETADPELVRLLKRLL